MSRLFYLRRVRWLDAYVGPWSRSPRPRGVGTSSWSLTAILEPALGGAHGTPASHRHRKHIEDPRDCGRPLPAQRTLAKAGKPRDLRFVVGPVGLEPTTYGLKVALALCRHVPDGGREAALVQFRGGCGLGVVSRAAACCRGVSGGSVEVSVEVRRRLSDRSTNGAGEGPSPSTYSPCRGGDTTSGGAAEHGAAVRRRPPVSGHAVPPWGPPGHRCALEANARVRRERRRSSSRGLDRRRRWTSRGGGCGRVGWDLKLSHRVHSAG